MSTFPEDVSLNWRKFHFFPYLGGGTLFVAGSFQYLPSISKFVLGGWLFTIGSAFFTFTDAFEWWKNNRVGCFAYSDYSDSYDEYNTRVYGYPAKSDSLYKSTYMKYKRATPGLNFFLSLIGSFLYLIGSILFIPEKTIELGTWVFIYGSACITISQSWKLYRTGCEPATTAIDVGLDANANSDADADADVDPNGNVANKDIDLSFSFKKLVADLPVFGIDFGAGIGGFFYLIGSILFLPMYDTTDYIATEAAWLFIIGGFCFFISGCCMGYKYFLANQNHIDSIQLLKNDSSRNSNNV